MDGCDTYAATADILARYGGGGSVGISTTAGRFGGGCVALNSSASLNGAGAVTIPHTGANAIITGCAFFQGTGGSTPIMTLYNSTASTVEITLWWDASTNQFRLQRGNQSLPTSNVLASTTQSFQATLWHHIEMKSVIADSGGTCEVRANGATVINYSGDTRQSSTGTAGVDRIYFCTYATLTTSGALDDMYIIDSTGPINNFVGDCRINTLAPSSDSAVQFTRSTGASNYLCVDEGRQNSDTDYVESATVGNVDKYGYTDLAAGVTSVYGVQVLTWAKKTDAAIRTMRNKLYSGGTTSDGSTFTLTTGYAPYATIASVDPNTSAQWTVSNANAALAGFEVVS